ncbi:CpaF family protein [Abyssibacter sp.]|uniref:CpaF family protein n=1 Tax=Abyssibacter sp. TaxID=2320200 RepID=UPI0025C6CD1F|nr:CpaF family protein [Abyssibacter sp.]MCK5859484.1 CpaF family protein [Abyssibacter sp.]
MAAQEEQRFRLSEQYQSLKSALHRHLIDLIDERNLDIDAMSYAQVRQLCLEQVRRYVVDHKLPVNQREVEILSTDARHELIGYGPIQDLVDDDDIDDIVVNGPGQVFVERAGRLEEVALRFMDDAHVVRVIQRILAPLGRRVDESTPMVDARLPDGSRVNAIIPPIALNGPCVSIRKFRKRPLTSDELRHNGTLNAELLEYLQLRVRNRANLLVVGGTGSGKTTLLNLLSSWIPNAERVVTIEDAAELRLDHAHTVRLESRPPNLEGERAITTRDLVRNALRMRPDRIIVGEVRGDEVLDMLQAMNTGHDGSMTTLHANGCQDAIHRLELLAGFAGFTGSEVTLRGQVVSAIDLMVHVSRMPSGERRVLSVTEIEGMRGTDVQLADVFRFDLDRQQHVDVRSQAH